MSEEIVAEFELNNVELEAEYELSEGANFDAQFVIDSQLQVQGEGLIDVTTTDGIAIISDKTYTHEQGISSSEWVIQHNLNKFPSVFAVDSTGTVQIPNEIIYNNNNQVTVQFISAFAGKAYLN